MTVEEAVMQRIVDVNTDAGDRVWLIKLPQDPVLPAVLVQRIRGFGRDQHLKGPDSPHRARVQVDVYASEDQNGNPFETARDLDADIRGDGLGPNASGLWGWIGEVTGSPGGIRILNIELASDGQPFYEPEELRTVRITNDYIVHWAPMN